MPIWKCTLKFLTPKPRVSVNQETHHGNLVSCQRLENFNYDETGPATVLSDGLDKKSDDCPDQHFVIVRAEDETEADKIAEKHLLEKQKALPGLEKSEP